MITEGQASIQLAYHCNLCFPFGAWPRSKSGVGVGMASPQGHLDLLPNAKPVTGPAQSSQQEKPQLVRKIRREKSLGGFWSRKSETGLPFSRVLQNRALVRALVPPGPDGSAGKESSAMQEMQVQSLGQEDLLVKRMATHSSILAWEIPGTEDLGGPWCMGSQRV